MLSASTKSNQKNIQLKFGIEVQELKKKTLNLINVIRENINIF